MDLVLPLGQQILPPLMPLFPDKWYKQYHLSFPTRGLESDKEHTLWKSLKECTKDRKQKGRKRWGARKQKTSSYKSRPVMSIVKILPSNASWNHKLCSANGCLILPP